MDVLSANAIKSIQQARDSSTDQERYDSQEFLAAGSDQQSRKYVDLFYQTLHRCNKSSNEVEECQKTETKQFPEEEEIIKEERLVESNLSRRYIQYTNLLRTIHDMDWASNDLPKQPIQHLTPICFWFYICGQYFMKDFGKVSQQLLEKLILSRLTTVENNNKKPYDYEADAQILEIRRLAGTLDPQGMQLEDLIDNYSKQLSTVKKDNDKRMQSLQNQLTHYKDVIQLQDIPYTDGLLRDMCGLTLEEMEYIDKREAFVQTQASNEVQEKRQAKQSKQSKNIRKSQYRVNQDDIDGALCQVCNDGDYQDDNLIVFCSRCNISVHQRCYMIQEIPIGDWVCDLCLNFGIHGQYLRCPFCTKLGGAMKSSQLEVQLGIFATNNPSYHEASQMTQNFDSYLMSMEETYSYSDGMHRDITFLQDEKNKHLEPKPVLVWVHLSCLFWLPECYIDETFDALKGIENVDKKRFLLQCSVCGQRKQGACTQCSRGQCQISYHPECARRQNKYISMQSTSATRVEYLIFCDKHTPFKLKRVLEIKFRLHEKEVLDFFKYYEKCRQHQNKQLKQRIQEKIIKKHLKKTKKSRQRPEGTNLETMFRVQRFIFNDEDMLEFAKKFRYFLEALNSQQVTIELSTSQKSGCFKVVGVKLPQLTPKSAYQLRLIPPYLKDKPSEVQMEILPYYRGYIEENDPIWQLFHYRNYTNEQKYNLYKKCTKRAFRFIQDLNPGKLKKQPKLLELFTIKKRQLQTKVEKKKDIIPVQVGNDIILHDDNIYCLCRGKFVEGNPMIQCEYCDEWYHYDCLSVKSKQPQIEAIQVFYCFLCENDLEPKLRKKVKSSYKRHFQDPTFQHQKELAKLTNLHLQRVENLSIKKQKLLDVLSEVQIQQIQPESKQCEEIIPGDNLTPNKLELECQQTDAQGQDPGLLLQSQKSSASKQSSIYDFFVKKNKQI